jgi:hypothetical protein
MDAYLCGCMHLQVARTVPRRPPQIAVEPARQLTLHDEIEEVLLVYEPTAAGVGGLEATSQQVTILM